MSDLSIPAQDPSRTLDFALPPKTSAGHSLSTRLEVLRSDAEKAAGVTDGQRFNAENPCPVCDGHRNLPQGNGARCWGFISGDGKYAFCMREEYAGAIELHPVAGYRHVLVGPCACGETHGEATDSAQTATCAWQETARWPVALATDPAQTAFHVRQDCLACDPTHKRVLWQQANGKPGLSGVKPTDLALYGIERLAGTAGPVVVNEGEKAADALDDRGILAVGTATGAQTTPGDAALVPLVGREVILWPDADDAGRAHMERIGAALARLGAQELRMVAWAEAPDKGDAADWPDDDDALKALLDSAPAWTLAPEALIDPDVAKELRRLEVQDEARRLFAAKQRTAVPLPEPMTLDRQLAEPEEDDEHRIEGWQLAGHRVLLSATRKAGKTTLRDNLIRALADGTRFLDAFNTVSPESTIAVFDFELSARQGKRWLGRQRIEHPERVLPFWLRGAAGSFDIRDDAVRAEWATWLREANVSYLIIDCLTPVLAGLGLNENTEARVFLYALDALLTEAAIPEALVVHHMGHGAERARGDSALEGWADAIWHLTMLDPNRAPSPRHLSAFGRDVETEEGALEFGLMTGRLRWVGGTRRETGDKAALADVVAAVKREPGISPSQLETTFRPEGVQRDRVRRLVDQAKQQGLVRVEKNPGGRGERLFPVEGEDAQ